jgi:hypothetical protein
VRRPAGEKPSLARALTLKDREAAQRRFSNPTGPPGSARRTAQPALQKGGAASASTGDLAQQHSPVAGALSPRGRVASMRLPSSGSSSCPEQPSPIEARPPPRINALYQVRVLHDFDASFANEVSVRAGDICDVAFDVMREQGWFEVVTSSDARGLIPVSFCEVLPLDEPEMYLDDDDYCNTESAINQFRAGSRDSGTIQPPSIYDDGEEYDYEDIDDVLRQAQAMKAAPPASPGSSSTAQPHAAAAPTPGELSPRTEMLRKRAHVVKEVYETERNYVNDLKIVGSLRKSIEKSGLVKEADIETIFRNVTSIHDLHKVMLTQLEDCVEAGLGRGGPYPAANASLASVFVSLSAYLKLYTAYCVPAEDEILTSRGFMSLDAYKARAAADKSLLVAGFDARTNQLVYERGVLREFAHQRRSLVELADDARGVCVRVTADHDLYVSAAAAAAPFAKVKADAVLADARFDAVRQQAAPSGGAAASAAATLPRLAESALFCELFGVWLARGSLADGRARFADVSSAEDAWLCAALTSLFGADGFAREAHAFVLRDARANELLRREYGHKFADGAAEDDAAAAAADDAAVLDNDGRAFDYASSAAGSFLRPERGTCKWLAWWTWLLDKAAARSLVAGLCRGGGGGGSGTLQTASARHREELVRLCLHAGFSAAWRRDGARWAVVYSDDGADAQPVVHKSRGGVRVREHVGRVWCFTMPSGFVWTRSVERDARGVAVAASRAVLTGNCTHQERGRELLLLRTKSSTKLQQLLKELQANEVMRGLTLETLLIVPIQRLCKYPLLMRELIRVTASDHPDYEKLPAAFKAIEAAAEHVNEQKSIDFSIHRMAYIDKNLSGRPAKFQLALPTRRFLLEGELLRIGDGTRQLRRVFLFSDLLISAKQKGKEKFQFQAMVALVRGQTFVELVSARIEPNAFQIITADNTNIFAATSKAVRDTWLKRLAKILGADGVRFDEPDSLRAEPAEASAAPAATAAAPHASQSMRVQREGSTVADHDLYHGAATAPQAQRGKSGSALRSEAEPHPQPQPASKQLMLSDEPPPPPPEDDDEEMRALQALANE